MCVVMMTCSLNIPSRGCNFARAPRGRSTEELRQAVFDTMEYYEPHLLQTWLENRFKDEGWTVIFTPPYLCNFLPVEPYWAYIKNSIGRRYFKGRDMVWIADECARRANEIDCRDLIHHLHGSMDDWISLDTILNGNHLGIQVPDENMREKIMSSNPKYLSETEINELQNPEENTAYFVIDDEGDVH